MDGWMSRTMGEIGEVIQAERIGLGDRKREGEGRGSPSFQHILSTQIFSGSDFPWRLELRYCSVFAQKYETLLKEQGLDAG